MSLLKNCFALDAQSQREKPGPATWTPRGFAERPLLKIIATTHSASTLGTDYCLSLPFANRCVAEAYRARFADLRVPSILSVPVAPR
jgi:hypothetical protein